MRLLVVGGSGLLGREVVAQARQAGTAVSATFHGGGHRRGPAAGAGGTQWHRLDVRDRGAVASLVARLRPDAVVNAAYRQADWVTTADGAMHVAAAAAGVGARLVHVSSDSVFSGRSGTYGEACVPCPGTVYGAAKAAAETAVKGLDPGAVIARTSLIVGEAADLPGALDVRLAGAPLRGAREFLATGGVPGSSGRPGGVMNQSA